MAAPTEIPLIAALDIGSSKVSAIIARPDTDGRLTVLGSGQRESRGVKRGYITDMAASEFAVREAVELAERMSGLTVEDVWASYGAGGLVSDVASVERLIGVQGAADAAGVVVPLTLPDPEMETIFPGPGMASPLMVLEETVILPFERTVPLFAGPLAPMPAESIVPPPVMLMSPQEKTPCAATPAGTLNESARTIAAPKATRKTAATRRQCILKTLICLLSARPCCCSRCSSAAAPRRSFAGGWSRSPTAYCRRCR